MRDVWGAQQRFEFEVAVLEAPIDFGSALDDLAGATAVTNVNAFAQGLFGVTESLVLSATNRRRLLSTGADDQSGTATRASLAGLLSSLGGSAFNTTDVFLLQLDMAAQILSSPEEVDCTYRSTLFAFLRSKLGGLGTAGTRDVKVGTTMVAATLSAFSALLQSLAEQVDAAIRVELEQARNTSNSSAMSNPAANSANCSMSLAEEAAALAEAMVEAVQRALDASVADALPGEKAHAVAAGSLCALGVAALAEGLQADYDLSACGSAAKVVLPSTALAGSGVAAVNLLVTASVDDPYRYAELGRNTTRSGSITSSAAGVLSVSFVDRAGDGRSEVVVQGLAEPFLLTIPHEPLEVNATLSCRWWDAAGQGYSTEGCEVRAELSSHNYTVCSCTHLTDFSLGQTLERTWTDSKRKVAAGTSCLTMIGSCLYVSLVSLALG